MQTIELKTELENKFIIYCKEVLYNRSIPNFYDNLKPVQRRILWAMHSLNLYNTTKKCARIIGEVLGKYHPHGDVAVYNTLVNMVKDYTNNIPLIIGQGNFGSIDGDEPAAMRYTEAKLSEFTKEVFGDIELIQYINNFDNTLTEPKYFYSKIPCALINGCTGIGVGFYVNILPHNINEVIDGIIYLIDNPECEVKDLLKIIKGPDFPTKNIICNKKDFVKIYSEGKGNFIVKSDIIIDKEENNIVIKDIPYNTSKKKILKQIIDFVKTKDIGIIDIIDETEGNNVKILLKCKKKLDLEKIVKYLYNYTDLKKKMSFNLIFIKDDKLMFFNLKQYLLEFIDYRINSLKSKFLLKIKEIETLIKKYNNYKYIYLNAEKFLNLLKTDINKAKNFIGNEINISDLKIKIFTKEYYEYILGELKKLEENLNYYKDLVNSEIKIKEYLKKELLEIKNKFNKPRVTKLTNQEVEIEKINEELKFNFSFRGEYNFNGKELDKSLSVNITDKIYFISNKGYEKISIRKLYKIYKKQKYPNIYDLTDIGDIKAIIPSNDNGYIKIYKKTYKLIPISKLARKKIFSYYIEYIEKEELLL